MSTLPTHVTLVDVGPRDGLQNEAQPVPAATKIELVHRLQSAGLREIEVTSFVSPKWVPQMGDNAEVMAGITRQAGVRYSVLTPNMKGFEGALAAKADEVVIFAAASEAFSQRNINCTIAESIERFRPVAEAARANGMKVRAAVSCALGCPYQGEVSIEAVDDVVQRLQDIGSHHIGIADTIGVGTAGQVQRVMEAALKRVPLAELSGHFHDTYGQALANILACLQLGVHTFDASVAGLGGCPYAKGATGNVATEDVVYLLHGLGIQTGIDLDKLVDAGAFISQALGRPTASRVARATLAKRARAA
ncbi:hydroxymethylglutaryl-CoA lyase [Aquabacterium parvum]|uniref:hydroxymethylglutaryl-CoA lyase n=1 Tax=Aquabacterium parvum TaxID=70584 RepID=UPI000718D86D|nr:hydroxymethylglutaryl-CoA lyase [Aquabacterium parvum]